MNYLEAQGMFRAFLKCGIITFNYDVNHYISLNKDFELTVFGIRIYNNGKMTEINYDNVIDIDVTMENDIEIVYKKVIEVKV